MLIDGHIIMNFGALADHAEAMIEEEALADLGAGVDVDPGQESRKMVHEARHEEQAPFP